MTTRTRSKHDDATLTLIALVTALIAALAGFRPAKAAPGIIFESPHAPSVHGETPAATAFQLGESSVSGKTGTATYAVAVRVPPGRQGMEPRLALSYSANSPLRGGVAAGRAALRRGRPAHEARGLCLHDACRSQEDRWADRARLARSRCRKPCPICEEDKVVDVVVEAISDPYEWDGPVEPTPYEKRFWKAVSRAEEERDRTPPPNDHTYPARDNESDDHDRD